MDTKFVSDGAELRAPGEPLPIVTASRLLAELGVLDAKPLVQRQAVRVWFQTNLPDEVLRASLSAAGLLG